ncbi:MAG: hypothetical protein ACTSUX_07045 [Promethearchaeota archaeon]
MIENLSMNKQGLKKNNIEEILKNSVNLFLRTGLQELAEKWDTILKTYISKKSIVES